MKRPEYFVSIQELLKWFFQPDNYSSQLSAKKLGLTTSYRNLNALICDLKIKIKGFDEESIFMNNPFILLNIRRGNSLLLTINPELSQTLDQMLPEAYFNIISLAEIRSAQWVRRGLMKFFDISLEELARSLTQSTKKRSEKDSSSEAHWLIFKPIEEALDSGNIVEVYQTEKANGENVQVSFLGGIEKWIISSKNCSIVVGSVEEIENYQNNRYNFAKCIANSWFKMLERVNDLEGLKEWLEMRTMVGEYVGNKEFEHIVKYSEESIKFYAVVENNSGYSCIPVLEAFFGFKRFGINSVRVKKLGSFVNKTEMYKELKRVFEEISVEDINSGGEGSVLYFVKSTFRDSSSMDLVEAQIFSGSLYGDIEGVVMNISRNQSILSLGKIKTLDYRIYRKIREKVKNLKLENGSLQKIKTKFEKECKNLCKGFGVEDRIDFFLDYFDKVATVVLESMKKSENDDHKSSENLNKFINIAVSTVFIETSWLVKLDIQMLEQDIPLSYISERRIDKFNRGYLYHNCIDTINFESFPSAYYYVLGYQEEDEQKFIELSASFKKTEDFPQYLLKFQSKKNFPGMQKYIHKYFQNKRETLKRFNYHESNVVQFINAEESLNIVDIIKNNLGLNDTIKITKKPLNVMKKCILLLPITVPGSGKTHIRRYLAKMFEEDKNIVFHMIDCDSKRSAIISKMKKNQPNSDFEQLFEESSTGLTAYIKDFIENKLESSNRLNIFYLDRNFSNKSISSLLKTLKTLKYDYKAVGLIPESMDGAENEPYAFSRTFLATCLKRILTRGKHELMMSGTPISNMRVVLEIFHKLTLRSLEACNEFLELCIQIPMVNEDEQILSYQQKEALDRALKNISNEKNLNDLYEKLMNFTVTEIDFGIIIRDRIKSELRNKGLLI